MTGFQTQVICNQEQTEDEGEKRCILDIVHIKSVFWQRFAVLAEEQLWLSE